MSNITYALLQHTQLEFLRRPSTARKVVETTPAKTGEQNEEADRKREEGSSEA
jgi:hypothetical protein